MVHHIAAMLEAVQTKIHMTTADEIKRFRAQYTEAEWERLMRTEFAVAWNADDLVKAGEIASKVLHGDLSYSQHRLRQLVKHYEF